MRNKNRWYEMHYRHARIYAQAHAPAFGLSDQDAEDFASWHVLHVMDARQSIPKLSCIPEGFKIFAAKQRQRLSHREPVSELEEYRQVVRAGIMRMVTKTNFAKGVV